MRGVVPVAVQVVGERTVPAVDGEAVVTPLRRTRRQGRIEHVPSGGDPSGSAQVHHVARQDGATAQRLDRKLPVDGVVTCAA
ncbi:MAG: hypothetical protein BGO98_04445 [Myxococcales bacterium 68-20]|nr:MAG: hypothetical protein BGO98_04445 [Myxococcales bacterium 68-20]